MLGSANVDLVTSVDIAPRPGETVSGRAFRRYAGGKGANQALAAARAGAQVTFLGAVGDDEHGRLVLDTLAASGVSVDAVDIRADVATGIANVVVVAGGENAIIVVAGANATMTSLDDRHRSAISDAGFLLLQFELPPAIVEEAAAFAAAQGVKVVLTPAPVREISEALRGATWMLVANEHEASALAGRDEVMEAGYLLAEQFARVLITCGECGSTLFEVGREAVTVEALPTRAVDTTGAGDTFVGALITALGEGCPPIVAMRWARVPLRHAASQDTDRRSRSRIVQRSTRRVRRERLNSAASCVTVNFTADPPYSSSPSWSRGFGRPAQQLVEAQQILVDEVADVVERLWNHDITQPRARTR